MPAFLNSLGISSKTRWGMMEVLAGDEDAAVRFGVMRAAPGAGLAELCFDRDGRVARGAFLRASAVGSSELRSTGPLGARQLDLLSRSPHADVRAWAVQEGLTAAGMIGSVHARTQLRRAMAGDRREFLSRLKGAMGGGDVGASLEALAQVRALDLGAELAPVLLDLAATDRIDPRVTATAVSLIGLLRSGRASEIAVARTSHPDPRVRANAVEVIGRAYRRGGVVAAHGQPSALIEAKRDPHHRVRANALRHWISGASADDLAGMLTDSRPMHRLAGVWVTQKLLPSGGQRLGPRWSEFVARVSELARFDEDARVKARAGACARTIQANVRSSWVRGAA
jgi:hypothetical protein